MDIEEGPAKGAGVCGIILLVCGVASSITGFIWIGMAGGGGFGVWSGVGLVIAGVLGIIAWLKRSRGVLIGFLVVTIIMIFVTSGQAIASGLSYTVFKVFADPGKCNKFGGECVCRYNSITTRYQESYCDKWETLVNSLLAITIFNVIGAIVCLVGSIFGCMGTCCAATQSQPGAVVVQQPVFMTTTTQHGYPGQQPGNVQQPGYAPQQQPGYAPQPGAAYPPPQYAEKQ